MFDKDKKLWQTIEQYRSLAMQAEDTASSAIPDKYKRAYRNMAKHWTELARELEECMNWPDQTLQ
jgi:hypothetical protein